MKIAIALLILLSFNGLVLSHPGRTDFNDGHTKSSDGSYHYHIPGSFIETLSPSEKLIPYSVLTATVSEGDSGPKAIRSSFGAACPPLPTDDVQLRPVTDIEWAFAYADWGIIGNPALAEQAKNFIAAEEHAHHRYTGVHCHIRKCVLVAKCKYAESCVFCNPKLKARAILIKEQLEEAVEKNLDAAAAARVRNSYIQSQADIASTLAWKNEEEAQDRVDENTKYTEIQRTSTIDGKTKTIKETEVSQSISAKDVKQFEKAAHWRATEKILQDQADQMRREAINAQHNANEVQFQMFRYLNLVRRQLGREKAQLYYSTTVLR